MATKHLLTTIAVLTMSAGSLYAQRPGPRPMPGPTMPGAYGNNGPTLPGQQYAPQQYAPQYSQPYPAPQYGPPPRPQGPQSVWPSAPAAQNWQATRQLPPNTYQSMPPQNNSMPLGGPPNTMTPAPAPNTYQPQPNVWQNNQPTQQWPVNQYQGGPQLGSETPFLETPYCDEPPAYPYSSGMWWRNGCWYGGLDLVIWHRTRTESFIIGVDDTVLIALGLLNTNDNQMSIQPGARATLGYILSRDLENRDHSFEFGYLGFNNWHGLASLESQEDPNTGLRQGLEVPFAPDIGGFTDAGFYSTSYRSSLHSLEFNYRVRNRPGRDRMIMGPDGFWSRRLRQGRTQSFIAGMRGIGVNERFEWDSGRFDVSPDVYSGSMDIHTRNVLFGGQIGGDCYDVHETWYWGISGKAGIFANFTRGTLDLQIEDEADPTDDINSEASKETAAFFGELSFVMGYNLTPNMIIKASYDLALLGGIALAPEQVAFDDLLAGNPPVLDPDGQIFFNGVSLGFELYW